MIFSDSVIISLHPFIYVMPRLIDNPAAWLSSDKEQDHIFGDRNNPRLEYARGKAILATSQVEIDAVKTIVVY